MRFEAGDPSSRCVVAIVVGMTVRHRRVMQVAAGGGVTWRSDDVSTEEPLEIRLRDVSLSVTMRTPSLETNQRTVLPAPTRTSESNSCGTALKRDDNSRVSRSHRARSKVNC